MSNQFKNADLDWRDGILPIAREFDDPYFSLVDGLSETKHVFLAGNDLPERFCDDFHVAELGFGTGLNLLACWQAWIESGQKNALKFTSFEAFPMTIEDMARSLNMWPELRDLANQMLEHLAKDWSIQTDTLDAKIIIGDARDTLPTWQGSADAWFLDGFSPAKNPELWEPALMQAVADHTAPEGRFATYSAAGFVRRNLAGAGFAVERIKGHGRKRHMTVGVLQ